jgi:hypothetical protein
MPIADGAGRAALDGPRQFSDHQRKADYYSIVAKAVGALDPNTRRARQQLYERARSAMISEMEGAYPPFHGSEIAAAKMSLENAIEKVEADAVRRRSTPIARAAAADYVPVVAIRTPPANQDGELRGSLKKLWSGIISRAAGSEQPTTGRDTWLTELLARASYGADNDEQDFAPRQARGADG